MATKYASVYVDICKWPVGIFFSITLHEMQMEYFYYRCSNPINYDPSGKWVQIIDPLMLLSMINVPFRRIQRL